VKRGRGRPRKNFAPPAGLAGPKRGPGRPRNSELLARFANSHRPPGAPQLLPELSPALKPATAAGKKRGRKPGPKGKAEGTPRADRRTAAPETRRNPSRLRNASGPDTEPAKKGSR
jgi:hypothetical protein